jgi:hypothetical protein
MNLNIDTKTQEGKDLLKDMLHKGEVVVTFNKLNGDKRVMTCTLQEGIIPAPTKTDPASQKKVRKLNEDVCVAWDTNAKGWRSFRWDKVTDVEPSANITVLDEDDGYHD